MALNEKLSKRNKIIILIIIILLILALLIYLFLLYYKPQVNQPANLNALTNQPVPALNQPLPTGFNQPNAGVLADARALNNLPVVNEENQRSALFTATAFSERFGSYSNQSNYKNFDELEIFMTDSMSKWAAQYKETLKKQNPETSAYYALVTKAISTQVQSMDETAGQAEILVKTQRQEFKNQTTNSRIFYQDILLKLLKINEEWKVNGAYWL